MTTRNKQIRKGAYTRAAIGASLRLLDAEARTVEAALSSETPVERWFGSEILVHDVGAVDLARAADGLPLLFNHDSGVPIGLVEGVRIDKDRMLRGTLRFSRNARAEEIFSDVRDGLLKNISIGYRINKWEESSDSNEVRVTSWMLYEASIAPVPADPTVGVNRNNEDTEMPFEHDGDPAENTRGGQTVVSIDQARSEGQRAERERIAALDGVVALDIVQRHYQAAQLAEFRTKAITAGWTADQFGRYLLAGLSNEPHGGIEADQPATVRAGEDVIDKFARGATDVIMVRAGLVLDREQVRSINATEFRGMTMVELARRYLELRGVSVAGLSREGIISKAITTRGAAVGHGSSDFDNILENVAEKSLMRGYNEGDQAWREIARIGSLPDFKTASRANLSAFSDLEVVYENGEYNFGTFSDLKETLQLVTYGKKFSISRQALANDDIDAFTRIPRTMGAAANRKVGDLVIGVLTSNPTLNQDATTLFHANHGNDVAPGSGAAPSVSTVDAARVAMATQSDPSGNATQLNIPLAMLIVPVALQSTAQVLSAAMYDPDGTAGTLKPNPVGGFKVVADARLDNSDPAEWFGSADPNMYDTIEVAFLDGMSEPYMESRDGWDTDGVEYKVRIDAVAAALDFRGLTRNDGN